MDVEVFLGGMSWDLDPRVQRMYPWASFYGRVRIGIMTPAQARAFYEDLFVTGYGPVDELIMGGIEVDRFEVRVPGGTFHRNHGGCPRCSKREDCHAWKLGDSVLYEPHTRFYREGEERDPRWPKGHNWRMCEGSLRAWTQQEAVAHVAQERARSQGLGALEAFGLTT